MPNEKLIGVLVQYSLPTKVLKGIELVGFQLLGRNITIVDQCVTEYLEYDKCQPSRYLDTVYHVKKPQLDYRILLGILLPIVMISCCLNAMFCFKKQTASCLYYIGMYFKGYGPVK